MKALTFAVHRRTAITLSGLVFGAAALLIALAAATGITFATRGQTLIPGDFKAWFTSENELPALNFEPNFIGMTIVIAVLAGFYTVKALRTGKHVPAESQLKG